MEKQLMEILAALMQNAAAAKDFMLSNVPDVVQQAMTWYFVQSLGMCVAGIVMLVVVCFFDVRIGMVLAEKVRKESGYDKYVHALLDEDFFAPYVVLGSLPRVPVYVVAGCLATEFEWLKIWIAPKLWLIEKAAELLK